MNNFVIINWNGTNWVNSGLKFDNINQANNLCGPNSKVIHESFLDCLDLWPSPKEIEEINEEISNLDINNNFEGIDE